jgi:hypothetical protein
MEQVAPTHFGENLCNRYFTVVASAVGFAVEDQGGGHTGKIGYEFLPILREFF